MIELIEKQELCQSEERLLVEKKIVKTLEWLVIRKDFWHLSQAEILLHAKVSKQDFLGWYRNKYDFLDGINQSYLATLLKDIPNVLVRKDYTCFFQSISKLINMESATVLSLLFSINRGKPLPSFYTLEKRITDVFVKRTEHSPLLTASSATKTVGYLLSESLATAAVTKDFSGIRLLVEALNALV
ncbi:hypothetical protein [Candidatus Enterococcus clewellii]|uniref:Uncharacterized protein n=1 Tax=Candidatus Enterococcus clewellii TaxID=1834193 RepID=A0A242K6Q0_9ENTE|nr:hypothetical protein [Enterococcus sp. 9E7_DIV0242]OTP15884.1 hypothetical protein A5888_002098 [Enterococcus sp. 9E7_DIV0242]